MRSTIAMSLLFVAACASPPPEAAGPDTVHAQEIGMTRVSMHAEASTWIEDVDRWMVDYRRAEAALNRPLLAGDDHVLARHRTDIVRHLEAIGAGERDMAKLQEAQAVLRARHGELRDAHRNLISSLANMPERRKPETAIDSPQR